MITWLDKVIATGLLSGLLVLFLVGGVLIWRGRDPTLVFGMGFALLVTVAVVWYICGI